MVFFVCSWYWCCLTPPPSRPFPQTMTSVLNIRQAHGKLTCLLQDEEHDQQGWKNDSKNRFCQVPVASTDVIVGYSRCKRLPRDAEVWRRSQQQSGSEQWKPPNEYSKYGPTSTPNMGHPMYGKRRTKCKMVYSLHFEVLTFPDTIGSYPFHLSPATKIVFIINKTTTKSVTRMEKEKEKRRKRKRKKKKTFCYWRLFCFSSHTQGSRLWINRGKQFSECVTNGLISLWKWAVSEGMT